MSPARLHRERLALQAAASVSTSIASGSEGGQADTPTVLPTPDNGPMTPARAHHQRTGAETAALRANEILDPGSPEDRATALINLRLQHDLRRLRDIQSIEKKINAKREMLPEYAAWVDGLVAAGVGVAEDVLPTVMIWRIDTGDFAGALTLAEHVLAHDVPLPARYERTAPALIVEEIATAALKAQGAGESFPLDILARVATLTADADMHDEIRAKLMKVIGVEQMRAAEEEGAEALPRAAAATLALDTLRRAQQLNERVGVKDRIKRLEKMLAPPKEPAAPAA